MGLFLVDLIVAFLPIDAVNTSINMKIILNISLLLLLASVGSAADKPKLEQFKAENGEMMLFAFSGEIGKVSSLGMKEHAHAHKLSWQIEEQIFPNKTEDNRHFYLQLLVEDNENGSVNRQLWTLKDLSSFIQAIDYFIKLDQNVTELGAVTGDYKSRTGLSFQCQKNGDSIIYAYALNNRPSLFKNLEWLEI